MYLNKILQKRIVGDILDLKTRRLFCMNKTANLSQAIHIMEGMIFPGSLWLK